MDNDHEEILRSLSHSDHPVVLEINRLQDLLKEKSRDLGAAQSEIKALRATEVSQTKAIEELRNEVNKLDKKLSAAENLVEHKNWEIRRLASEKKSALAAQYTAEATLRRVYADEKDDDPVPIESIIAPLEAEIKMYKNEIAKLQDDKKVMERLMKSKESALLEAERILKSALERALIVEEVQNQNYELKRQIEICQEENKILEKTNRQKVLEVEKLSQTIRELEETVLAGGAAANTIRDYKRRVSELNEEKRTLERELARAKVSASRVASAVANEWKDENDKVMPVKQWLEERRLLQAEMQRLREKLAISERTAKAEAQLKEKFKLRLNTLEEALKNESSLCTSSSAFCESPRPEKASNIFGLQQSNAGLKKRSTSQPRASTIRRSSPLRKPRKESEKANVSEDSNQDPGDDMIRKNMWASRSKIANGCAKENTELKANTDAVSIEKHKNDNAVISAEANRARSNEDSSQQKNDSRPETDDVVSGFLYDKLQKEVINLRRTCQDKDNTLDAKEHEIQILIKKVEVLSKAIQVETRKAKRDAIVKEKEAIPPDAIRKIGSGTSSSKR